MTNNEMENNYLAAAIDALNKVVTTDVSPRLASKVVRFRKILTDYANANKGKATQRAIEFAETDGATDANGNEINDVYTV